MKEKLADERLQINRTQPVRGIQITTPQVKERRMTPAMGVVELATSSRIVLTLIRVLYTPRGGERKPRPPATNKKEARTLTQEEDTSTKEQQIQEDEPEQV